MADIKTSASSAVVTRLPNASQTPTPKQRWYGPYPAGVTSIARYKHRQKRDARAAAQKATDKKVPSIEDQIAEALHTIEVCKSIAQRCRNDVIAWRTSLPQSQSGSH